MTKKEAISIISKCAALYDANLCDRQLAFVYRDGNNQAGFVEVIFRSNNFMHFTGIDTKNHIKANAFYRNALDKRLKEPDIQFKNNHTTELKLQILQSIMNIPFSARMIGDYTGAHLDLYTEKIAGTTTACLGSDLSFTVNSAPAIFSVSLLSPSVDTLIICSVTPDACHISLAYSSLSDIP